MKVPAPQQPVEPMSQPEIPTEVGTQGEVEPQAEIPTDDNDNPFANQKFDAGIDVDEEADPILYIQKLSGKLAQKLRDFNETSQDTDKINKFATNTVVSATIPSMTPEDAQDVIKKVKDNIGKETGSAETEVPVENEPVVATPEEEIPSTEPVSQPPRMEAKIKIKKPIKESETIDELVEKLLRGEKTELKKSDKKKVTKKPFTAPKFK